MSDIVNNTPTAGIGAVSLKAAGLIATTTAHLEVEVNKCSFAVQMDWTACEIATGDEVYVVCMEANTRAAPTVWTTIGHLAALGATAHLGGMGDATATGSIRAGFSNPYDYQVRAKTWVSGSIATGINSVIKLYDIQSLGITG